MSAVKSESKVLSPILITTADVGNIWPLMTAEQSVHVSVGVDESFEASIASLSSKVGAFVVEVIGDEAILAGKTTDEDGLQVFIHCSKRQGLSLVDVLVVSQSPFTSSKVSGLVKSI
jgi:hypothetical protein